jgi:hypothetical protein
MHAILREIRSCGGSRVDRRVCATKRRAYIFVWCRWYVCMSAAAAVCTSGWHDPGSPVSSPLDDGCGSLIKISSVWIVSVIGCPVYWIGVSCVAACCSRSFLWSHACAVPATLHNYITLHYITLHITLLNTPHQYERAPAHSHHLHALPSGHLPQT